jgi:hypothetical protein
MPYRELPWSVAPPPPGSVRLLMAAALRLASAGLALLAHRVGPAKPSPASAEVPSLEFYAEAGAPEGALYVDGKLVGQLPGVTRL